MTIRGPKHQTKLLIKSFEFGIKDVLEIDDIAIYQIFINYLKNKKYLWEHVESKKGFSYYFFFKKESDRLYFIDNLLEYVKENKVKEICTQYGLLMGYPPKACEFFPQKTYDVENGKQIENIFINYNGMVFASYVETINEDFEWLFANKPLDSNSFILIERTPYKTNNSNWKRKLLKDLDWHKTTGLKMKLKRLEKMKEKIKEREHLKI